MALKLENVYKLTGEIFSSVSLPQLIALTLKGKDQLFPVTIFSFHLNSTDLAFSLWLKRLGYGNDETLLDINQRL